MKMAAFAGIALLTLSACGQDENPPASETATVETKTVKAEPQAAPGAPVGVKEVVHAPTNLSPYVGKYPFDKVDGHRFLDHPAVKAAIAAAVPDAKLRENVRTEDDSVNVPIINADGRILAWGGSKRAEDRYNWAVVIAPDGSRPEVCIYDGLGYGEDFQASQWFEPGRKSIMKQGKCPSSTEDYPPNAIAAG